MINLRDALNLMENVDSQGLPVPFSIKVLSYDEERNTGGKWLEFPKCIIERSGKKSKKNLVAPINEEDVIKRNPNHSIHLTRNILILPRRKYCKIHIHLIKRINGELVF